MSDTSSFDGGDTPLAAEYVLGLLDSEELRAFETRLAADPALGAEVRVWSEHLAGIAAAEVAPVTPPARVRRQLEARLFAGEKRGWISRLGIVQALVGAAAAALILLVATNLGVLRPDSPEAPGFPEPAFQAEIASETGDLRMVAAIAPETHSLILNRLEGEAPEGRVLELWAIPPETGTPISIGVLPAEALVEMAMPEDFPGSLDGATLAVSEEPPGGSPTGAPTGAVLASGPVTAL